MVVQAFPGANIMSLTQKIKYQKASIKPFTHVIIHVGTNDIHRLSIPKFFAAYTNMIAIIRQQSNSIKITLSSILPRPVDHDKFGVKL